MVSFGFSLEALSFQRAAFNLAASHCILERQLCSLLMSMQLAAWEALPSIIAFKQLVAALGKKPSALAAVC